MAAERPEDVDEAFNRIVGSLGPGWGERMPAWPDPPDAVDPAGSPDADQEPGRDRDPDVAAADHPRPPADPGPRGWSPAEPAEEHFSPPPPPPLPRPEPVTALCWLLVLGAPVLLMLTTLAGWSVPRWALGMVALGFVGGVVALVLRLDDRPRDTDNGAVL